MLRKVINSQIRRLPQIHSCKYVGLYKQGQSPETSIREYFYYIDHQGMVGEVVFRDIILYELELHGTYLVRVLEDRVLTASRQA
jgi:hypothetical protein